jgi:hypothetical protein
MMQGDDCVLISSVFSVLEPDTVMVPPSTYPPYFSSSTLSVVRLQELERCNEHCLIKTKASNAAAIMAIDSPMETPSAGRGPAGPDGMSTTDARCAPAIVSPNKDPLLALTIVTMLMLLLSFTVMEIILHQTVSLIATSMIAFVITTAPPPPSPVMLADDAVGGIVPQFLPSLLQKL